MIKRILPLAPLLLAAAAPQVAQAADAVFNAPAAVRKASEGDGLKTAIFAGGCFWGIEGVFSHMKGVTSAVSGYHGGSKADARYRKISSGKTGHAEAVRVTYDPKVVRYDQLLRVFFSVGADPTTLNYQGPDHGTQYRSALVPLSKEQAATARAYLAQMRKSGVWDKPIVTRIESYKAFYPAEAYHQDFMKKNPRHGYIRRWDQPKVDALKDLFPHFYRSSFRAG